MRSPHLGCQFLVTPEVQRRHDAAAPATGYLDPDTGLFVLTSAYLAERGECCDSGWPALPATTAVA